MEIKCGEVNKIIKIMIRKKELNEREKGYDKEKISEFNWNN